MISPFVFAVVVVIAVTLIAGIRREVRRAPLLDENERPVGRVREGAPVRIVGITDALDDPDRYAARQRWSWHVTPERMNGRRDAQEALDRHGRR